MASIEFGVPPNKLVRKAWEAYALLLFPTAARAVSPGWRQVGRLPGRQHRHVRPRLPSRTARIAVARRRNARRAHETHEPGRRRRHVGPEGWLSDPAFYALRVRRMARLRLAAPPALHALASVVRRARMGGGTGREHRSALVGAGGVLPRRRDRRARARRAERPPARNTQIPTPVLVSSRWRSSR